MGGQATRDGESGKSNNKVKKKKNPWDGSFLLIDGNNNIVLTTPDSFAEMTVAREKGDAQTSPLNFKCLFLQLDTPFFLVLGWRA